LNTDLSCDGWFELNDELLRIGRLVTDQLVNTASPSHPARAILLGFTRKVVNTLQAIQLLARNELWEESQSLTRIIFELRVTFDCFLDMYAANPKVACDRVFHSMIIEKMKQINSYPEVLSTSKVTRTDYDATMVGISQLYTDQELENIKKHGFTGISIEERSKKTGHHHLYQVIYRNLSRNVHSTDFAEQIGIPIMGDEMSEYQRLRNYTILYIGDWSAGGVIARADIDDLYGPEMRAMAARSAAMGSVLGTYRSPDEGAEDEPDAALA
jgi:hypothetical protein